MYWNKGRQKCVLFSGYKTTNNRKLNSRDQRQLTTTWPNTFVHTYGKIPGTLSFFISETSTLQHAEASRRSQKQTLTDIDDTGGQKVAAGKAGSAHERVAVCCHGCPRPQRQVGGVRHHSHSSCHRFHECWWITDRLGWSHSVVRFPRCSCWPHTQKGLSVSAFRNCDNQNQKKPKNGAQEILYLIGKNVRLNRLKK